MAGDPFLSDPSRKRKRQNKTSRPKTPSTSTTKNSNKNNRKTPQSNNDDDISGSDTDEDPGNVSLSSKEPGSDEEPELSSDEEFNHESAADKRRRLAKQYLENLQTADLNEEFSAKDLDDDIVGRRLQRDVAETRGHIYKFYGEAISSQMDEISPKTTRIGSKHLTSMAISYPYLYTTSKDIELIKWDISQGHKKPVRVKHTKGGVKYTDLRENPNYNHHCEAINCVAASSDGKFVVTGGKDGRLIIWAPENLTCLKVLETRSPINSISFRKNSDQLFAACADLKIRTYSINQFSQVEILYGHQDNITDISALTKETCVSVGSRDRTALFWKIPEESRLTFRGGDSGKPLSKQLAENNLYYPEGSIDCVSMVDESHFLTGSDNGNLCFWALSKKKPLFTQRIAHDLQPEMLASQASSEATPTQIIPERQPYWITSLHGVPYSDIFFSGSYSGELKIWRIDREGLRSFKLVGVVKINGCINRIDTVEVDSKLLVYVLVSKEHKFGRWVKVGGKNSLVSFALSI